MHRCRAYVVYFNVSVFSTFNLMFFLFFFAETNTDNSDVNDQHQEAKNNITTETVDSPSTEVIDSIVIKQEPDWDDQEEGVGVNDEDMHGSLQGYEENNEDGLNSSDEEEIDENNEMLNECEGNSIYVRIQLGQIN